MSHKRYWLIAIIIALSFAAWLAFSPKEAEISSGHEQVGEHAVHDDDHGEEFISLSTEELHEFNIQIEPVKLGRLEESIDLTGEIKINEDRLAHISTYSAGVVKSVHKSLGDKVWKGQLLATLASMDISSIQENYLAKKSKLEIAKANFVREKELRDERLTTQDDFLQAKETLINAKHELHSIESKLKIYGHSDNDLANLEDDHSNHSVNYKIIAPYDGVVISKDISIGEVVERDKEIFSLANLTNVWVDFTLYQNNISQVSAGTEIEIEIPNFKPVKGKVSFVSPLVGDSTRTAFARVILANPQNKFKPGTFVTGRIKRQGFGQERLLVKNSSIQEVEGNKVVFIRYGEAFKAQEIELGESNDQFTEVISGLEEGLDYVSVNSFTLKAEMQKSEMDEERSH